MTAAKLKLSGFSKFRCNFRILIGGGVVCVWIIISIITPLLAPYGPTDMNLREKLQSPTVKHLCGTDRFGRDIFSRILFGSRSILIISTAATCIGLFFGTSIGLIAGWYGGLRGEALMRFMDILMSFPDLLFALLVISVLGGGSINVVAVISVIFIPRVARVAFSATLSIKHHEFIRAAQAYGEKTVFILIKEILPNILGPLAVEGGVRFTIAIYTSASLGFLGLGVQPPTPDWGLMINEAQAWLRQAPWATVFPAMAILSLVIGFNFLLEGARDFIAEDRV